MLRTNLSTRPFYNERAVHVMIGIAAVLIAALTITSVTKLLDLSRRNTELSSRVSRDHGEAENLTREAARIRRGINQQELAVVAAAAREANSLIDQRTFSWTEFFNEIEATIPPDVMLASVRPAVSDGGTHVSMVVVGQRPEDIDEFMEKLEATGMFEQILSKQQDRDESDFLRTIIEALYVPQHDAPEDEGTAAPAKPEAGKPPAAGKTPSAPGGQARPVTPPATGRGAQP